MESEVLPQKGMSLQRNSRSDNSQRNLPGLDWWNLAKLAGAAVLLQAIFWLVVFPALTPPPPQSFDGQPIEDVALENVQLAQVSSPHVSDVSAANYREYDGSSRLFHKGYYSVRAQFELESVPGSGLALQPRGGSDNVIHFINGVALPQRGVMDADGPSYHRLQPSIEPVPNLFLRPGTNTVESVHVFGDPPRINSLAPPRLGDFAVFSEAYRGPLFFRNEVPLFSAVIGFVLAGFLLIVLLRAQDKHLPGWLFLLTLSWAMHSLFFRWAYMPIHGEARVIYYSLVLLIHSACWPIFVDAWTDRPHRKFRWLILAILVVSAGLALWWIGASGDPMGWTLTQTLLDQVGLFFFAATFARLVWHFVTVPNERRLWEAALLLLLATLIAIYLYNLLIYGQNTASLRLGQPVFLLLFAIMFFSRNFRLFRSTAQLNSMLRSQLDQRTLELETAHAREKELVRLEAHGQERQRIMRDMHDGLGSNLMSMLMMAKRGKADHADYAEGLQQVIDEMRLMIDSMDSVGESLAGALAIFRKRVVPRAKAAGFDCNWQVEADCELPNYSPRTVLQIFRILQEAYTNALKHSTGDRIDIAIGKSDDPAFALQISVRDNGGPGAYPRGRGRGIDNMIARAASFGGILEIDHGKTGTTVRLKSPPPSETDVASSTAVA